MKKQSSDETALLAAILANPEDDQVRLVYADWLDENGPEGRAGLIRDMVLLHRQPFGHPERTEAQKRVSAYLSKAPNRRAVLGPELYKIESKKGSGIRFGIGRGMVDYVETTPEAFEQHVETIFKHAPIRGIKMVVAAGVELGEWFPAFEAHTQLKRINIFDIENAYISLSMDDVIERVDVLFFGSQRLGNVRALKVNHVGSAEIINILKIRSVIEELDLSVKERASAETNYRNYGIDINACARYIGSNNRLFDFTDVPPNALKRLNIKYAIYYEEYDRALWPAVPSDLIKVLALPAFGNLEVVKLEENFGLPNHPGRGVGRENDPAQIVDYDPKTLQVIPYAERKPWEIDIMTAALQLGRGRKRS